MRYAVFLLAAVLHAQPSCSLTFSFSGTGRSAPIANHGTSNPIQPACNTWVIQFWVTGFSAAVLEFDAAPDVSGSPGSWSLAIGAPFTGTNPLASGTSGIMVIQAYAPFFSVNVNSVTGTGNGVAIINGASGITARASPVSANTALSNLTSPTAINQNLLFSPDNTFTIGASGASRPASIFSAGSITGSTYLTSSNCANAGGTCGSAAAGSVTVAAAATTVTVATTAVHTASEIFLTANPTKGGTLAVTCNTTIPASIVPTTVTNGVSFVITVSAAPVTNPLCIDYAILN